MSAALRDVVESGTGRSAAIGRSDVAGKTGTTDNHSDAWFVGFTPELSTSEWMGYADSQRPLLDVRGQRRVYGGTISATTWATFMDAALEGTTAPCDGLAGALTATRGSVAGAHDMPRLPPMSPLGISLVDSLPLQPPAG